MAAGSPSKQTKVSGMPAIEVMSDAMASPLV
jgi:hypothetical protein